MWKYIKSIENVISELHFSDIYLSYYTSDYVLHFRDKKNLTETISLQFQRDNNYVLHGNKLYISNDSQLCIVDICTSQIIDNFDSGKQYISTLTENLYLASSYVRSEKTYENLIISNKKEPIYEIKGEFGINNFRDPFFLLINRANDKIAIADIGKKQILWESILSDKVNGTPIIQEKFLIVPLSQSLIKKEIESGLTIWELAKTFHFYNYNESGNQLYGLGGKTFEVINVETGER